MIAPVGPVPLLADSNGEVSVGILSDAIETNFFHNHFSPSKNGLKSVNREDAMSQRTTRTRLLFWSTRITW